MRPAFEREERVTHAEEGAEEDAAEEDAAEEDAAEEDAAEEEEDDEEVEGADMLAIARDDDSSATARM